MRQKLSPRGVHLAASILSAIAQQRARNLQPSFWPTWNGLSAEPGEIPGERLSDEQALMRTVPPLGRPPAANVPPDSNA